MQLFLTLLVSLRLENWLILNTIAVSLEENDNVDDEEIETNSDLSGKVTALATEIKSLKRMMLLSKLDWAVGAQIGLANEEEISEEGNALIVNRKYDDDSGEVKEDEFYELIWL